MRYLSIALLFFATMSSAFSYNDIHYFMTAEEVQQVFNTDPHSVPTYEVASVHWSEESLKQNLSEGCKLHVRAFDEDINFWLHPGDSILVGEETPVYYAKYAPEKPNEVEYTCKDYLMATIGRIFEDPLALATFVIGKEESGRTRVNGCSQSNNLVIKSLPTRVAEEYRRRRRSAGDSDDFDSPYHIIYRSYSYEENYPELLVNVSALREKALQQISGIPDTLYPEILVSVEYSITKAYEKDIVGLLLYLLAFWHGVDLKYRSLESPNFRLRISGFIVARDYRATPYISNSSLGVDVFDADEALKKSARFFYNERNEFPTDSYDVVVTMTRQIFGVGEKSSILGLAFTGMACTHFHKDYGTLSMSIVQDDGAFKYVLIAAHELGHLFGADHDHMRRGCYTKDGHIMARAPFFTKNTSDFSNCSLKSIDTHLKDGKLDCLFNKPHAPGKSLPKLMPGRVKSLDEQCKSDETVSSCESPDVCVDMYCVYKNGTCGRTGEAASAGTRCGYNKFCLHMECVSL